MISGDFSTFTKQSGFKVLAVAKLGSCEYSLILYLVNCAVSGLDQLITTDVELASLIGFDEVRLNKALNELYAARMIRLHYGEGHGKGAQALRIGLEFDVSKWLLDPETVEGSQDAVVFPFRRKGENGLHILPKEEETVEPSGSDSRRSTWKRVFDSYIRNRSLDEDELQRCSESARMLVQTHPVDQVLLMIRHFGNRVPTLSLLASSWQHYQEIFEQETQKVDMLGARQKHKELDEKLRESVERFIAESQKEDLSSEETNVLNILLRHRHPRRQLFWAYQARSRYPKLGAFFDKNAELMLPVTTSGFVIKKHD